MNWLNNYSHNLRKKNVHKPAIFSILLLLGFILISIESIYAHPFAETIETKLAKAEQLIYSLKHEEALDILSEITECQNKLSDKLRSDLNLRLATLSTYIRNHNQAVFYLERAETYALKAKDYHQYTFIQFKKYASLRSAKKKKEAEIQHEKALKSLEKYPNSLLAQIISINTEAIRDTINSKSRIPKMLIALEICDSVNSYSLKKLILFNISIFHQQEENHLEYWKTIRKFNQLALNNKDTAGYIAGQTNIANYYEAQNKIDSSFIIRKCLFELAQRHKAHLVVQENANFLANYYSNQREFKQALFFEKQKSKAQKNHEDNFKKISKNILGLFDESKKELDNSKNQNQKRLVLFSSILLVLLFAGILMYQRYKQNLQETKLKVANLELEKRKWQLEEENNIALKKVKEFEQREIAKESIAREFHDKIANAIIGLKNILETRTLNKPSERHIKEGDIERLDNLYNFTRSLSHFMHIPAKIENLGDRVNQLISDFHTYSNIKVDYDQSTGFATINEKPKIKDCIFLCFQELLLNTYKHSKASLINIIVIENDNEIEIIFEDNGIGLKDLEVLNSKNLGLKNLHFYIENLGGSLRADEETVHGTTLIMKIPVDD